MMLIRYNGKLIDFSYFGSGLANGGSAGLFYSYMLSWAGFLAVMTSMAELASMAPTSSGQYYWVYILAPKPVRKLLSYLTGKSKHQCYSGTFTERRLRMVIYRGLAGDGFHVWLSLRNADTGAFGAKLSRVV